jgi:HPt (histidine-containing phosphotransfer) domain-containing protein
LDVEAGLSSLMGRVPSYLRLLGEYARGGQQTLERLGLALDKGDLDLVRELAHSAKGAAGTLGLVGVQARAKALEMAVRNGEEARRVRALAEELRASLAAALSALLAALNQGDD